MNRLVTIAAGSALLAFRAGAQDPKTTLDLAQAKLNAEREHVVKMKMMGAVKGMTVTAFPIRHGRGQPNRSQVLADGTRIHRENKTSVYRDGEGRVRRETPDSIMIRPIRCTNVTLRPESEIDDRGRSYRSGWGRATSCS